MSGVIASPLFSGAAIAAVLAAVAMLYLLRPPARRVLVPSSLIWDRVLRSSRRRDDRLRWWFSLLLAGVIAGLIAFSVLRSQSAGPGSGTGRVVIVLDNSPTMATRTGDGGTRFEQARRRARELISSLAPGQQVLLVDTMRMITLPAFDSAQAATAALDRLSV
ncbi:MAG: BatA domain-containing protein, partial [Burkholderiales bacterium]